MVVGQAQIADDVQGIEGRALALRQERKAAAQLHGPQGQVALLYRVLGELAQRHICYGDVVPEKDLARQQHRPEQQ